MTNLGIMLGQSTIDTKSISFHSLYGISSFSLSDDIPRENNYHLYELNYQKSLNISGVKSFIKIGALKWEKDFLFPLSIGTCLNNNRLLLELELSYLFGNRTNLFEHKESNIYNYSVELMYKLEIIPNMKIGFTYNSYLSKAQYIRSRAPYSCGLEYYNAVYHFIGAKINYSLR